MLQLQLSFLQYVVCSEPHTGEATHFDFLSSADDSLDNPPLQRKKIQHPFHQTKRQCPNTKEIHKVMTHLINADMGKKKHLQNLLLCMLQSKTMIIMSIHKCYAEESDNAPTSHAQAQATNDGDNKESLREEADYRLMN